MEKQGAVQMDGVVREVLPGSMFRVSVANAEAVLATLGGAARRARPMIGDAVALEVSTYDLPRGRIVGRRE